MTDDVHDDLAEDLHAQLRRDPDVLHKNATLYEAVVLACVEDGYQWSKCQRVMREARIPRDFVKKIKLAARKMQGVAGSIGEPFSLPRVAEAWKGAPVSKDAEIPRGWGVNSNECALYQQVERQVDGMTVMKEMPISFDPFVICRRIKHLDHDSIMLELAWRTSRTWHKGVYDRDEVFKKSGLVGTAADGAPVADDNAMDLVKYLRAYESHNLHSIDLSFASSSMGWKGTTDDPTADGFLCGSKQMCLTKKSKLYMLKPMGPGDKEEADTVRTCGTFDAWKQSIMKVSKYAAVRIGVYAGLASVLLPILGAPNTIVEWVKGTSTGKTRVLHVVQSLWKSSVTAIPSWDNTVSNVESKAHLFTGIPLFIDDTKAVVTNAGKKGEEQLGKTIYKFVNGVGRGRDQRSGGQRAVITWRTILFSTGETPSSELAHAEGAAARVLSFWTAPWGKSNPETGAMIDRLVEIELAENYGHAGPAFVQWVHDNRALWDKLRGMYEESTRRVREMFNSRAADRLARVVALIDVTAVAAHIAGIVPWPAQSVLDDPEIHILLQASVKQAERGANDAQRAWEHMLSEAESRSSQWIDWNTEPKPGSEPHAGWLGWRSYKCLAWYPSKLRQVLEAANYNYDSVCRAWQERGMLLAVKSQRGYAKALKIGESRKTSYAVCLCLEERRWYPDGEAPPDLPDEDEDI